MSRREWRASRRSHRVLPSQLLTFTVYSCYIHAVFGAYESNPMTQAGELSSVLPRAPLLITESKDEFDQIHNALDDQIKPRGIIEQMYVEDIAHLVWEVLRLRRSKVAIVNMAIRAALTKVITQLLLKPGGSYREVEKRAEEMAYKWFSDPDVKNQIARLLQKFDLNETAIQAEAFRESADDLERIDRLMASAEARRDKALVCIAQYRSDFGALLRESSDRLVESKVLNIEHDGRKERNLTPTPWQLIGKSQRTAETP